MNRILTLALLLLAFSACSKGEKTIESPAGYDFSKPVKYVMPEELAEISGIAFAPGSQELMYAIQDEDGQLFYWKNGHPKPVTAMDFGKHGDYEDLGITKKYITILRSDGILFNFPLQETKGAAISSVQEWKNLVPEGEYEGLYADDATDNLYVLCKNCGADRKTGSVSGYILHLDEQGRPAMTGNFKINTDAIQTIKPKKKNGFRPSALTFNKRNQEWYILSSVNKSLVVTDKNWHPKQVVALDPGLFPQPEGITFDIDNNLYISNEAGNTAKGTVLKFMFQQPGR
ncbi:SdiA-regulated domain-containing protein [Taibaiella koreensis]|uniref:SdiA-regulated domain-containing protein n=1 Tax=Taibaiella koreensis TaxID=1268548 RepID=UPI000E59B0C4|nr:SdiA-regulated domain-containing protein [Taibaiella koreensis]